MQTTRRHFIRAGFGWALGTTLSQPLLRAANPGDTIPIGFQLYTVRGEFSRDVPGTLKTLGQLGYLGVEFWGYGGTPKVYQQYTAEALRKLLDENRLKCCGMHLELRALAKENLPRTIENNQVLGNEYLTVAAAQDKMRFEDTIGSGGWDGLAITPTRGAWLAVHNPYASKDSTGSPTSPAPRVRQRRRH